MISLQKPSPAPTVSGGGCSSGEKLEEHPPDFVGEGVIWRGSPAFGLANASEHISPIGFRKLEGFVGDVTDDSILSEDSNRHRWEVGSRRVDSLVLTNTFVDNILDVVTDDAAISKLLMLGAPADAALPPFRKVRADIATSALSQVANGDSTLALERPFAIDHVTAFETMDESIGVQTFTLAWFEDFKQE